MSGEAVAGPGPVQHGSDQGPDIADPLEGRYRTALRLLPPAYRRLRGEEMLGTLMEGAGGDRRWPRIGEVASIAGLALRERFKAAPARAGRWRQAAAPLLRAAALGGTALMAVKGLLVLLAVATDWPDAWQLQYQQLDYGVMHGVRGFQVYHYGLPALWLLVLTALVLGRHRSARILALAATAPIAAYPRAWAESSVLTPFMVVTTLTLLVAFTGGAPRIPGGRRWVLVLPVAAAVGYAGDRAGWWALKAFLLPGWADTGASRTFLAAHDGLAPDVEVVVLAVLAVLLALRARRGPQWPVALAVLGSPILVRVERLRVDETIDFRHGTLFVPLVAELLAIAVALYAVALQQVRRRRKQSVGSVPE